MNRYHRRDFLRMGAALAAGLGLQSGPAAVLAEGLERIFTKRVPVLWMQGLSCTGCSVSLLNAESPSILQVLTELISLTYHSTVSAAQGDDVARVIERVVQGRNYLLVMEGAIPTEMPEACVIGGKPLEEVLEPLARNAAAIVAAGTCAGFGGVPSAEGNPTGAVGLQEFMTRRKIPVEKRLVNCPGCPVHPSCLVGTLAYVAARGYPPVVPGLLTPELFYRHSVHDECPRFHFWEKDVFAERFGDEGCLFKLGCLGPLSHTTCPRHQWNGGVNWCVRAGAPCNGCTSEHFAKRRDFPFYRKSELYGAATTTEAERRGAES
jgi:hydrogenase small subunit